jgi:hypothetical protein
MNKFHQSVLIGMTVFGLGAGAVSAQADTGADQQKAPAATWQGGHGKQRDPAKFREHMEKRINELHDKLKLSASQEPAWKTYIAAMQPQQRPQRPDRAEWAKLSAPERMEKALGRMKDREAQMADRLAATKTFYATLTPEQQKVFNDNSRMGPHGGHGRHHGQRGEGAAASRG